MSVRILATSLLSLFPLVLALTSSDVPTDVPISSLLASADHHLAKGETNDALVYYDVAIARDSQNYLTYFKRGTTYLSLGRNSQAIADFDKVLSIKPGFKDTLAQRAKIKARNGDWEGSKKDFLAHGNSAYDLARLEEARAASDLAASAGKFGKWDPCIIHATKAIAVASKASSLRSLRARCRLEVGEVQEGITDLRHVLQLQPGTIDPHIQISAALFYGLSDIENGIEQLRKCLHSDPESKMCKKLYRRQKYLEKQILQVKTHLEKRHYATALKTLVPANGNPGIVQEIKDDINELIKAGTIMGKLPNELLTVVLHMTCKAYFMENNLKKGLPWCEEALKYNEISLYGLLSRAKQQMLSEQFNDAVNTLNFAAQNHPDSEEVNDMLQDAQTELRRSKTKDYYKVLGVSRDADALQIKSAYRRLTKLYHPDKAHKRGISKEEAEKKMAAINEAHEILSNKELRHRYDQGDDPNNHEQQHSHPFEQSSFFYTEFPFAKSGPGGMKFDHTEYQFHFG